MRAAGTDFENGFESITAALARRGGDDRPAFTYWDYREPAGRQHTMSWADLDRRARAVAARLSQVCGPGERVALVCPQNLEYVIGFAAALYAGMIAVPLYAPEVNAHGERLVGALADCDPQVWLTSSAALPAVNQLRDNHPVPQPKQVIAVDEVAGGSAYEPVAADPEQPAYLQYTSGSTRRPAGAVITHRAVAANIAQAVAAFGITAGTTCVGWLPFFHDMGLIQHVCVPLAIGCRSAFSTPFDFVRRPARWLTMLGSYPGVLTAAPNFAYDLAAARLTTADRDGLDLSGVAVAINGSEPIRPGTLDRFLAATEPLGFPPRALRPSYGLAEATVLVSTTGPGELPAVTAFDREWLGAGTAVPLRPGADRALPLVSAGVPAGQLVRIVDQVGRLLPAGSVGEIWLHGPNLASGYWRQPERSAETFGARLSEVDGDLPAGGWLRTGDLGVWYGGQLYITGRLKDLIIVDGRNHYPQDIEATVEGAHPAIQQGRVAVFTVDDGEREELVVLAETGQPAPRAYELAEIGRAVRVAVSRHHDLRLQHFALVPPGGVVRTSSGKVARAATRRRYLAGREDGS